MFSATEAERLIFTLIDPLGEVETISLAGVGCLGRVLAASVTSQLDFPHWDNSAMDGYAVRACDVEKAPTTLEVIEEIPAGKKPEKAVKAGQAARILTGAMLPDGADTVVMQEETMREANRVTILQVPRTQSFVRHRGSFYQAGATLLEPGQLIAPPEVALLAAAQQTEVSVYRRPRVAILSTGSELVRPDQPIGPGQIVDSNQYALAALVTQAGAQAVPLGIIQDERAVVKDAIASALTQADMVISTGGVSVGDYDYIDAVLEELGATLHIRSVAVKPGKPLTVASFDNKTYFGLPGNPASAMVGFWRFVGPAIAKLSGAVGPWGPTFVWAEATSALTAGGKRETYLWGQLAVGEEGYIFGRAAGSHSSGNLVNLANTSGLGVVPVGQTLIEVGQPVQVLKIR
ncbi:MAG: gephyrin-like molybdotransferase Glp [Cyanobacteria bacterium P01_C01_bin.69]